MEKNMIEAKTMVQVEEMSNEAEIKSNNQCADFS